MEVVGSSPTARASCVSTVCESPDSIDIKVDGTQASDATTVSGAACKAEAFGSDWFNSNVVHQADSSRSRTQALQAYKAGALPASVTGPIFYEVGK